MRFRLRTLLILAAIGPPLIWLAWFHGREAAVPLLAIGAIIVTCVGIVFAITILVAAGADTAASRFVKSSPMFRYRLRTLLIVLALAPPVLAWGWFAYRGYIEHLERQAEIELVLSNILTNTSIIP